MEEIKVNEYVRTKNGKIRKLISTVAQYYITDKKTIMEDNQYELKDIVKHSFDIKDLVQAGDIITYKLTKHSKFLDIALVREYTDARTQKKYLGVKGFRIKESQIEIMEILTKEQFNQMKYIVGDE